MKIVVLVNGKPCGPFELNEVQKLVSQEIIPGTALAWHEGMDQWVEVRKIQSVGTVTQTQVPEVSAAKPVEATWYYLAGDKTYGPLTAAQIKEHLAAGTITPTTYVTGPGMQSWEPANTVAEFQAVSRTTTHPKVELAHPDCESRPQSSVWWATSKGVGHFLIGFYSALLSFGAVMSYHFMCILETHLYWFGVFIAIIVLMFHIAFIVTRFVAFRLLRVKMTMRLRPATPWTLRNVTTASTVGVATMCLLFATLTQFPNNEEVAALAKCFFVLTALGGLGAVAFHWNTRKLQQRPLKPATN